MSVTYGGYACVEPNSALESCERLKLSTWWYGLPNQYTNPLGCQSGTGHVLMLRRDLDALDKSVPHDLLFKQRVSGRDKGVRQVRFKNLHVVNAQCVTPGLRGDPKACYLVELADPRRLARASPVNQNYNVRSAPGGAYFPATMNSGTAWTWTGIAQSLWNSIGVAVLGSYPGLPSTPHGTPENWKFAGSYALPALGLLLDRMSMALRWNHDTGAFTIVATGGSDPAATQALLDWDHLRVHDADFVEPDISRYPASVQVFFAKHRKTPDTTGASQYHTVTVAGTAGYAGTVARVMDDLPALYDETGTLTNSAALTARAAERASNFYAQLSVDLLNRVYAIPLWDSRLLPGITVQAVRVGDRGRGMVTQFFGMPGDLPANVHPDSPGAITPKVVSRSADGSPLESSYDGGSGGGGGTAATTPTTAPSTQSGLSASSQGCCETPSSMLVTELQNFSSSYANYSSSQTYTATGATQNNFVIDPGVTRIDITATSDTSFTGFTGGVPGKPLYVYSTTSSSALVTLEYNDAGSDSANRLDPPGSADFVVQPGTGVFLTWSGTAGKWVYDPTLNSTITPYKPTGVTGSFNNYNIPAGVTSFVPTLSGNSTFTGFDNVPVGGYLTVVNPKSNSFTIDLSHDSGSSSSGNKMWFGGLAGLTLDPGEGVTLYNEGSYLTEVGASSSLGGGSSGAGTLLATVSVSNAATLDVTGLAGYRILKVFGYAFQTKNALLTNLLMRTSANNGSSYDSGGSDYNSGAGTAAQITISVGLPPDSTAANTLSFEVTIYEADVSGASRYKVVQWNSSAYSSGLTNSTGSGARLSDGVIDALRFLGTTANLNGTVKVYGYN